MLTPARPTARSNSPLDVRHIPAAGACRMRRGKAALREIALKACAEIAETAGGGQNARAIARAFHVSFARSSWSRCEEPPNCDLQQIRPRPGQLNGARSFSGARPECIARFPA